MLYESSGIVKYTLDPRAGPKVVIEVDPDIARYYFSLLPKSLGAKRQGWPAHISIVRKQVPTNFKEWGRHEGEVTTFLYENIVDSCPVYFWIHAFTLLGETIREELGLPIYNGIKVPAGHRQRFHITIGNLKE